MAMTDPTTHWAQSRPPTPVGPVVTFGLLVTVTMVFMAIAPAIMPRDFAMPIVSTMFLLFASIVALASWRVGQTQHGVLSYGDVAGALTLFGIFAGIMIEPEQLVRLIEGRQDGH